MKPWMTALVVAAGGGALIAMSAAQAAAFTPTPSTTAAVPAPEGDSGPNEPKPMLRGDAVRLPKGWLAYFIGRAAGLTEHRLDRAAMLDVPQPKQAMQQVFINPCPKALATCTLKAIFVGPVTGTTTTIARAYPGDEVLDPVAAPAPRR